MHIQKIYINPEFTFNSLFFSYLAVFYLQYYFAAVLVLYFLILFVLGRKVHAVAIFIGLILGLVMNVVVLKSSNSSSTGLPMDQIKSFSFVLVEDSFRSAKGKSILKGSLQSVVGIHGTECSASGSVLFIGESLKTPFFLGERVFVNSRLNIMKDSIELNYISFSGHDPESTGWSSPFFYWRKNLLEKVDQHSLVMSEESAALFSALFTGNSDRLSGDLKDNFRKSGVPHLLALSGFHVAIIVLILSYFVQKFLGRVIAVLLCIPCLVFYLFFAGPSPSLLRAVLMFITGGVFLLSRKESDIFQILIITCLLQLLISPVQGFSLSFQLSYLALAGILLFGKRINSLLRPWCPAFLSLSISASVGAHIMTAPILIYHFGELYPSGMIASIFVTPLITIFMWVSLITFLFSLCGFPQRILELFSCFCDVLFKGIEKMVDFFSCVASIKFSGNGDILIYISIVLIIVLCLYIQAWRSYGRRKSSQIKLRFPIGNKSTTGDYGTGTQKKVEPEFSH